MGVYIEGLNRPRNEYIRIHIDFDDEVWVFREKGWELLGIKATNLDLVKCRECKHSKNCTYPAKWNWCPDGERKADENVWETLKAMKESEAKAKEVVKDYIIATYGSIDNL